MASPSDSLDQSTDTPADNEHTSTNTGDDTTIGTIQTDSLSVSGNIDALSGFDPAIHAVNADGTPKRKSNGDYALKRGKKPGQSSLPKPGTPSGSLAAQGDVAPGGAPNVTVSSEQAAKMAANCIINLTVAICGEEVGKPESKEEAEGLKNCFKDYFDVRGVPDVPPELGLVIGLFSYMGHRLTNEKALSRIDKLKIQFAGIIAKIRGK